MTKEQYIYEIADLCARCSREEDLCFAKRLLEKRVTCERGYEESATAKELKSAVLCSLLKCADIPLVDIIHKLLVKSGWK